MRLRLLALLLAPAMAAGAGEEFNARVAVLEPFPREIGRGQTLVLRGQVRGAFRAPELIVIAPGGKTYLNKDNLIGEHDFVFSVRFEEGPGAYRLEIMARKPESIRSAARFTIWHGRPRPTVPESEPPLPDGPPLPPEVHPRLVERLFQLRLNAFRAEIGLEPVGWNEAVAARAREHAARMARAERRMHRFGGVGVGEMLEKDGAGPGGDSGPSRPWAQVSASRPFPRPAPQPPAPLVFNYVVPFVLAGESLEVLFQQFFVRESAFRICAADPHCLEIGVGAARTRPGDALVYFAICFVQVNDVNLRRAQDKTYAALLARVARRKPEDLRLLGRWGRGGRASSLLAAALSDRRPEVAAAAWDGLLLTDERRAEKELDRLGRRAAQALRQGLFARSAAVWQALALVRYDGRLRAAAARGAGRADQAAREELERTEGRKALEDLLERCRGLDVEKAIRAALES